MKKVILYYVQTILAPQEEKIFGLCLRKEKKNSGSARGEKNSPYVIFHFNRSSIKAYPGLPALLKWGIFFRQMSVKLNSALYWQLGRGSCSHDLHLKGLYVPPFKKISHISSHDLL